MPNLLSSERTAKTSFYQVLHCIHLPSKYFTALCSDGNIRLEGGTLEEEGRVEICMNEAWGTVCNHSFTSADVNVVCKQLGYSRYSEFTVRYIVHGFQ